MMLDVDALLVLAISLAAKRRAAELVDILAAAELLHGSIPGETRLLQSLLRLGERGIICEVDGAYALTPAAQAEFARQTKKTDTEIRLASVKSILGDFPAQDAQPPLTVTPKAISSAVLAHREAAKSKVKNLLMPKPKVTDATKPGQRQRKPLPGRSAKAPAARRRPT
jgi:hypothetical protein